MHDRELIDGGRSLNGDIVPADAIEPIRHAVATIYHTQPDEYGVSLPIVVHGGESSGFTADIIDELTRRHGPLETSSQGVTIYHASELAPANLTAPLLGSVEVR